MTKRNPKTRFQRIKAEAGERRCIVSGEPKAREELVRFVLGPENIVYPDLAEKLEGRGVWVCASKSALQTAMQKRLFNKGFGRAVKIPEDLDTLVETGLKKRALDLLGFARKSGQVEMGFDKIKDAAAKESFSLLLEAVDGSEAEQKRLSGYLPEVPVLSLLTREEMGFEMGREACVHLAVRNSPMTLTLKKELMRLAAFLDKGQQE